MATRRVRVAGAWATKPEYVRIAGAWVTKPRYVRVAGAWVLLSNEHTVSPDNYSNNVANGSHSFPVSSNVTGGVGPFTYSWSWQSGGLGMTITNATSATCNVESNGTNQERTGIIQCTVTDTGNGNLVRSGTGEINVIHGTPV